MIEFRHFWGHDHYDIVFNQNQLFSELTLRNMRLHCNSSPSSIRSGSGGLQHPCDWYCNKILKHNLLDNDFQYCTKRHLALVTLKMIWLLYPPLIFYTVSFLSPTDALFASVYPFLVHSHTPRVRTYFFTPALSESIYVYCTVFPDVETNFVLLLCYGQFPSQYSLLSHWLN